MKKIFIFKLFAILLFNNCYSQASPEIISDVFPEWSYFVYTIKDMANTKVFDQNVKTANVQSYKFHGDYNQQWLVMPTYPGSNEAVITSRANGKILDRRKDNNNIIAWKEFHGHKNQIWKFEKASNGSFYVYSKGTNLVIDRSIHDGNIKAYKKHGRSNQMIEFEKIDIIPNKLSTSDCIINNHNRATPPPQLTNLYHNDIHVGDTCGTVLVGQTIIPYIYVKDKSYTLEAQVKFTPYYRLVRRQYYKVIDRKRYFYGEVSEFSRETTIGYESSSSSTDEIENTLNIQIDAEGLQSLYLDDKSQAIGLNAEYNLNSKIVNVTSFTEKLTKDVTYSLTKTTDEDQLFIFYKLIDEYCLYRMNEEGANAILKWTQSNNIEARWFPEHAPKLKSGIQASLSNNTILKSSELNSLNSNGNESIKDGKCEFIVNSNSNNNQCQIIVKQPNNKSSIFENKELIIDIYSTNGLLIKQITQSSTIQNYNLDLPSGIYIFKCIINSKVYSSKGFIKNN